jgi:hypothetical protein
VIADPPFDTGAVNEIVACPFPLTAVTSVGASGTVAGVTELLVPDEILVPTELVAVTVKVYDVPFVKPVTVIGEPLLLAVKFPGDDVTV